MAARRLHHLIYVTIANCTLFLIVCAVALGTNMWFSAQSNGRVEQVGQVKANFGLFNGGKTQISISQVENRYSLKIVCDWAKGCMFSCGTTGDKRKLDLDQLLDGGDITDYILCSDLDIEEDEETFSNANAAVIKTGRSNSSAINADEDDFFNDLEETRRFINVGLYLSTIACLVLAMIFAIISGMLALYNTYRTPIQAVLSVYGLYYWNGTSAGFVLLTMIMWLIEFITGLRKNAAISDTLTGTHDSDGNGSLGVSFWILLLPILFALANIAILKYRAWKIVKMNEGNVRVIKNEEENGETILF